VDGEDHAAIQLFVIFHRKSGELMIGLGLVKIRSGKHSDHEKIVSVMPEWWGGRDLSSSVLKIFFIHFNHSTFIAEIGDEMIGFLVGFMSQSEAKVGYIHFAGVHPKFRKSGICCRLYEKFYGICIANDRSIVKSCTSPVNNVVSTPPG
jgi:predicted GNAT superfamily acetyltransferase